jgi:hypothetical protein
MKNQRFYLLTVWVSLLFILSSTNGFGQMYTFSKPRNELSASLGTSIFRGDVGGSTEFKKASDLVDFSTIGFVASVGYRQYMRYGLSFRSELNYSLLKANDGLSSSAARKQRNLHFTSHVLELSAGLELSLMSLTKKSKRDSKRDIYVLAQASAFRFNPRAKLNQETYNLRDYGTEGQGYGGLKPYPIFSYALIGGFGYRQVIKNQVSIGIEFSIRKSFTDFIDDVSGNYPDGDQLMENNGALSHELSYRGPDDYPSHRVRGNPKFNDNFGYLMITYSKALTNRPHVSQK